MLEKIYSLLFESREIRKARDMKRRNNISRLKELRADYLEIHSQRTPFKDYAEKMNSLISTCKRLGIPLEYVELSEQEFKSKINKLKF
jgi:hypothetical protein